MTPAILGLDIGTASTKAILFDLDGQELAAAQRSYGFQTPQPGWVEQQPEAVWQAVAVAIRAITAAADTKILALAMAAQSGSLLPVRADGSPLYPFITWLDGRTEALAREWQAAGIEAQLKRISGWRIHPGLFPLMILWLKRNRPDIFAAADRYLSANDFLVHRLTGRFCMNPSNGSGAQLIDVARGQWSGELCALVGIEPEQLSPIEPAGAIIGQITAAAADQTGLPEGTPVVNGGHDQSCTALALGVTEPGRVMLACGTSWVVNTAVTEPDTEAMPPGLNMHIHPAPARWTVSQSLGGLGASLEWLIEQCWSDTPRDELYPRLNDQVAPLTPVEAGPFFLPMCGGHKAPTGMQHGGFVRLRLDHSRADMARAVMEGAAFELRWALERMGLPIEQMQMVGGAAQSPVWPQIVADISRVSLSLPQYKHWPALGAAILAGVGAGVFATMEEGQSRFQKPAQAVLPDQKLAPLYQERFAAYRQYYKDMDL